MSEKQIEHVGIIMDGNRRWARKRGLEITKGHEHSIDTIEGLPEWLKEFGIKYCTLYTFSTENWNRSQKEINYLMNLLVRVFRDNINKAINQGARILISGRSDKLSKEVLDLMREVQERSSRNDEVIINFALNYGGRAEIVDAIKKMIADKTNIDDIDEMVVSNNMYHPDIPDPDLIIRTGGDARLSNFLTWQSVYSELYFTDVLWPDFSREDFKKAIESFKERGRRFGK